MSYILHLIDAPDVTNAKEAGKFVSDQRALPPSDNPKFAAFVNDITEIYPDLSEDDEDGDGGENLWDEGIDALTDYGNVKELVVNVDLADEAVLAELIKAAVKNGLKLYDEEGEVVYPE